MNQTAVMIRVRHLLILLLAVAATGSAHGQWLTGYLRDSATHFPIRAGTITNSTNNLRVRTDASGLFRIKAAPNDLVFAAAPSYRHATLRYSTLFSDTVVVYLAPTGAVLPTVTVTAQYTKYQLDSMERKRTFEENRGRVLPAIASRPASGFGLTVNLDRFFKKKYQHKQRNERMYRGREEQAYVDYRFSPHLVAYYTGLKGDELKAFMQRYTPSYEWLRQHPYNEDVMYYLNDKIKLYKARRR